MRQGNLVDEFERLCEVQSDKATIEITSRFKGEIVQLHFLPGDIVKVKLLQVVVTFNVYSVLHPSHDVLKQVVNFISDALQLYVWAYLSHLLKFLLLKGIDMLEDKVHLCD